ncbi:hypothetical protein [Curtobacterium sp. ZW137]|uniref:hypothetical protein n=1 Tax=Curtobacterium sp. ZW137 TaxID=2485104 RepID=UPI000F4D2258|nr:hypothetical protein [Curtobacterium sp. ZW137]ROP63887.1 hypothetical protein EDF55_2651 [Curtobacterium sp. ZW137]
MDAVNHVSDVRSFDWLVLSVAVLSLLATIGIAAVVNMTSARQRRQERELETERQRQQRRIDALRMVIERLDRFDGGGIDTKSPDAKTDFFVETETERNLLSSALDSNGDEPLLRLLLAEFSYQASQRIGGSNSAPMPVLIKQLQADLSRDVLTYSASAEYRGALATYVDEHPRIDVLAWLDSWNSVRAGRAVEVK